MVYEQDTLVSLELEKSSEGYGFAIVEYTTPVEDMVPPNLFESRRIELDSLAIATLGGKVWPFVVAPIVYVIVVTGFGMGLAYIPWFIGTLFILISTGSFIAFMTIYGIKYNRHYDKNFIPALVNKINEFNIQDGPTHRIAWRMIRNRPGLPKKCSKKKGISHLVVQAYRTRRFAENLAAAPPAEVILDVPPEYTPTNTPLPPNLPKC
ncbi:uncharacterized protein VTP21DRAFT_9867 [Calcarisporiella thermophila]|uniref:uncharacterized protein n=1 Tax=Calcarisporiella thermophila TaxID=911321 RepID=UPI003742879A